MSGRAVTLKALPERSQAQWADRQNLKAPPLPDAEARSSAEAFNRLSTHTRSFGGPGLRHSVTNLVTLCLSLLCGIWLSLRNPCEKGAGG